MSKSSDEDDSGKRDLKKHRIDFNRDGFVDSLECFYHGGSGYGGWDAILRDGRGGKEFRISSYGGFFRLKKVIPIPPELLRGRNRPFLVPIKECLLPARKRKIADPSLQWVLDLHKNGPVKLRGAQTDNRIFDLAFRFPIRPFVGPLRIPESYYMDLGGRDLRRLYRTDEEAPAWLAEASEGWLLYYGHNHRPNSGNSEETQGFREIVESDGDRLFKSAHGLVLKRKNSFRWIFVSDFDLVGAPDKLRWSSMGKTRMQNGLVFLLRDLHSDAPDLWVIDPRRGRLARLSVRTDEEDFPLRVGDFRLARNRLWIIDEYQKVAAKYSIARLKSVLNRF